MIHNSLSTQGILRARDAVAGGHARTELSRLVEAGKLEHVGRGLYSPVGAKVTEHHALALAAARWPNGVVCLLSALSFHELGTQSPHELWFAVDVKAWKPVSEWPPLHVVRFSGVALTHGVEVHNIEGVDVRITSREKTVADCFKYRNKVGLDVALESLREYLRSRKRSMDALNRAAVASRVARVMRPYLEALA
jgi:predicted transcriptional regulator of viral defense system